MKTLTGLSSIKIGAIAADGDMGTSLAVLGKTYKDTATFAQEAGQDITHEAEELDDPFLVIPTKGKTTVKFGIYDVSPANLAAVLGGSVTGTSPNEVWNSPDSAEVIEKSIEIADKAGKTIKIPRASIKASIDYKLAKSGIMVVNVEATVLAPTKSGVKSITI